MESLDLGFDVALVQMPFASTAWPSLGLGLLKAALTRLGIKSRVFHFNALFAPLVGPETYLKVSNGEPHNSDLLGEWVFTEALFGPRPNLNDDYYHEVILGGRGEHRKHLPLEEIQAAWERASLCRSHVESFLEQCLASVDWSQFKVVGFTSAFQQHTASLALAKRLKARFPHLNIIFGGANCEGPMGIATLKAFDFIDAVCTGEGDISFPDYVSGYLDGRERKSSNIVTRDDLAENPGNLNGGSDPLVDMDLLPYPDFDDYFAQKAHLTADSVSMMFETSRGCWWGQKNHCTFCGLNGGAMTFRHKSANRAIEEIEYLLQRHGSITSTLSASDNIIPYKYFDEFLPKLASLNLDTSIFYETKANLRKEQLIIYKKAGLNEIQPGIESLDTDILRLMRKGVSGIQNIQLLKWCKELDIFPYWNLLFGFPGEPPSAYLAMASTMPKLFHLTPPIVMGKVRFDRFSPYVVTPEKFKIKDLRPYPAYGFIYDGLAADLIADMAYFFAGDYPGMDEIDGYVREVRMLVGEWQKRGADSLLVHIEQSDSIVVLDTRPRESARAFTLSGLHAKVFAQSDAIVSMERLEVTDAERLLLPEVIETLQAYGLLHVEGERLLRLTVPLDSDYEPPPAALEKLKGILVDSSDEADNGSSVVFQSKHIIALGKEAFFEKVQ